MLWLPAQPTDFFHQLLADNDATAVGLRDASFAAVDAALEAPTPEDQHDIAAVSTHCAVAHRLGHPGALDLGMQICLHRLTMATRSDLGRAAALLNAAVLTDAALGVDPTWRPDDSAWTDAINEVVQHLRTYVDRGNPHQAGNNWWAVTHSGVVHGARALELLGQPQEELLAWAWGRLQAFTCHFGDAGLYHEGPTGYQRYTCGHLVPAIFAMAQRNNFDPVERFPWLRVYANSILAFSNARWNHTDNPEGWGASLSWNDGGTGWASAGDLPLAMLCAPAEQLGGLRQLFDRLHGCEAGKPNWNNGYAGMWFMLIAYPYQTPHADPNDHLRTQLIDSRQGYCIWRSSYAQGNEQIFGLYAKHTHVGGHEHADAGSVRYMADGQDWLIGGGQARPRAEFQSVCYPEDGAKGDASRGTGWLCFETPATAEQGPIWGVDLRKTSGCYHERFTTVQADGKALSLLDLVDDHVERNFKWSVTIPVIHDVTLEGNTVRITAKDGATATIVFLAHQPDEIHIDKMPDSQRTYSSGGTHHYPGHHLIHATFAHRPHLVIHAVLTSGPDNDTFYAAAGNVHQIQLKNNTGANISWERPYGVAIPPHWSAEQGGTLSKWPNGITESAAE
jgi:hypothetical protein